MRVMTKRLWTGLALVLLVGICIWKYSNDGKTDDITTISSSSERALDESTTIAADEEELNAEEVGAVVDDLLKSAAQKAPDLICPFTIETYPREISFGTTRLHYEYDGGEAPSMLSFGQNESKNVPDNEKNLFVNDLIGDVVYAKVTFKNPYDEPAAALGVPLIDYDEDGKIWCWLAYGSCLYKLHYTLPLNWTSHPGAMVAFSLLGRSSYDTSDRVWITLAPGETKELYFAFELNPWLICDRHRLKSIHKIDNDDGSLVLDDLNVYSDRLPNELLNLRDDERVEASIGLSFTTKSIYDKGERDALIAPTLRQEAWTKNRQSDLSLFESNENSIPSENKEDYALFAEKLYAFAPTALKGASTSEKDVWKELYRRDYTAELFTRQIIGSKPRGDQRRREEVFKLLNNDIFAGKTANQIDFFKGYYAWKVDDFDPSLLENATES